MNEKTQDVQAPRIIDPGAEGWAPEPNVSQPELLLYGDYAGVIRLLGSAAAAASDAYSLACKHADGRVRATLGLDPEDEAFHRETISTSWQLSENACATLRELAQKVNNAQAKWTQQLHNEARVKGRVDAT